MEPREEGVMESPMLERHAAAETLQRGRERKNVGSLPLPPVVSDL